MIYVKSSANDRDITFIYIHDINFALVNVDIYCLSGKYWIFLSKFADSLAIVANFDVKAVKNHD